MAKEIPYFKFIATEFLTGSICYESYEMQGLFLNICALYWQRGGSLEFSEIEQRYKKKALIAKLTPRFVSVESGYIKIKFLDEQLSELQYVSKRNSVNGKLGGKPAHKENLPTPYREVTDSLPTSTNIEEEIKKKENKKRIEKELPVLIFPFESEEFKKKWEVLRNQKKWKGKSFEALQGNLEMLGKNCESDALKMMQKAINGGWQGVFELDEKEKNNNNGRTQQAVKKPIEYKKDYSGGFSV